MPFEMSTGTTVDVKIVDSRSANVVFTVPDLASITFPMRSNDLCQVRLMFYDAALKMGRLHDAELEARLLESTEALTSDR